MVDEITMRWIKKLSVPVLILLLLVFAFIIIQPIFISIITGLILAFIAFPLYKKLLKIAKKPNLSAFLMCVIVLLLLFIPLYFIVPFAVTQIFEIYSKTQQIDIVEVLKNLFPTLFSSEHLSAEITANFRTFVSAAVNFSVSLLSDFITNLPKMTLQMVIILFVFFFSLRDAEKIRGFIKSISPFPKEVETTLEKKFKDVTGAVVFGHIFIGILQGLLTGIGLFVLGVPNALTLTILAMFLALFPFLGAGFVWFPSAVYLFIKGHPWSAVALILYGAIVVSWIDNLLRPHLVARKVKLPSIVVLIGMIGGLIAFGVLGLILGPLILVYLITFLESYRKNNFPSLIFRGQ